MGQRSWDLHDHDSAIATLTTAAKNDLKNLSYPSRAWTTAIESADGETTADVLIIGAGQSGIVAAAALRREGIERITVIDQAPAGFEGPWSSFARMPELRTPKSLVGSELGIPSLSVQRWYEATNGPGSWDHIERIPTPAWHTYLEWLRTVTGTTVVNEAALVALSPTSDDFVEATVSVAGAEETYVARTVVLATGFDGAGAWQVPSFISERLDPRFYDHSNTTIDFKALRGKRIGVLGHGASACDNATAAIHAGARSVDICFRRDRLPRTNPHRFLETAGLMTHYPELDDKARWEIAQHFRSHDQPPPEASLRRALELSDVTLRPSTPWLDVRESDGEVLVSTPEGVLAYDHLILATGSVVDLSKRPELSVLAPVVRRWTDAVDVDGSDCAPELAELPYLDAGYAFVPTSADNDWVRRVFAFNSLSVVSHGPHSTSISGHKHALPRMVRGVTRRLFLDEADGVVGGLKAFDSQDLSVPDDFETNFRNSNELSLQTPRHTPARAPQKNQGKHWNLT